MSRRRHAPAVLLVTAGLTATMALPTPALADAPPARASDLALPSPLTLPAALAIFRERGFDLLIADAQALEAQGDVTAANAIPNPSVLGGLYHSFFRDGLYETHNGWFAGIGDSNAIADTLTGKRHLRGRIAEAALAAAKLQRGDAQRTLEFQVKQQYYEVLLATAAIAFAEEVASSTDHTFQLNQARYHSGAISEVDLSKTEVAKLEAEQAVDSARQTVLQAKTALGFLLGQRGRPTDFQVDVDALHFVVPPQLASLDAAELTRRALQNRPDLQLAARQRQRASGSLALARRLRIPDIGVDLQYQQEGSSTGSNGVAGVTPPTLQLSLSTTLPVFYQQQGEIQRAAAELRVQDIQSQKLEAQIAADVESAFNGFTTSRKLVERMQDRLLERARRTRDLVAFQYEKGAASLLELLDAQRTYISTNLEYFQDLAGYWTSLFQLEQAVAMDLSR